MEQLYLDNFRGFKNQYIEIRDVNFLVGENSSGKTSALVAMNTLFNLQFWYNGDFSGNETPIFSFEDMVSAEAKDKTYFRLGYFYGADAETSFLFEFNNKNGKPAISKFALCRLQKTLCFLIEDSCVYYTELSDKKDITEVFSGVSKNNAQVKKYLAIPPNADIAPGQLLSFYNDIMKENLRHTTAIGKMSFIAPIRSKPKKTYDEPGTPESTEGDHIPYTIRQFLSKQNSRVEQKINSFGVDSGLFKSINIKEYDNSDDAPFRMNFILNKEPINIVNIGYGVSQVLPVIFDLFARRTDIMAIQQPEVHLHPKAQAALGDIFYNMSTGKSKKKLIVETHSDYIIDRFRQRMRKTTEKPAAHVVFFLRKEGYNQVFSINIDDCGNYGEDQPAAFREFFIKEELENLGL